MPPTQKVRDLAESIVQVYVSYGFTDWGEAVNECVDTAGEDDTTYTENELTEAEDLARVMATRLQQSYDAISKEVLEG